MTTDDWRVRYDGLSAEADRLRAEAADLRKRLDVALFLVDALRAQVRPEAISEKHRGGNWWLVWDTVYEAWINGRWRKDRWVGRNGSFISSAVTHALPMPPAPEVKNDVE